MRLSGVVPAFTVESFLGFGLFPHRGGGSFTRARVREMAERSGIDHLMKRPVGELSTGEFQLVQVARALVQNSSMVILDEPVSNLDYGHAIRVMEILRELNASGATVLCALHDVNTASVYSSRIVCVKNGMLVSDGAPSAVVTAGNMRLLYDNEFLCMENPVSGSPMIVPVPGGGC